MFFPRTRFSIQSVLRYGSEIINSRISVEPAIAEAFLAKNPGSIRRVAQVAPVRLFPNTFLFRKGDTALRDAINVAIVELTNSRRLAALIKPYDPDGSHFIIPNPPVSP